MTSSEVASAPAVSVVVCTYDRPDLLVATVRGCLAKATRRALPYEVVVSDNSPDGYAEATLNTALGALPVDQGVPLRVVRAAPPNISVARNVGVAAARAPLVAFLDDDLDPDPGWLDALVDTLTASGADVVAGPVRPIFTGLSETEGISEADAETCWWCLRDMGAPSATPIVIDGPQRTQHIVIGTENTLWRKATTLTDPAPFDPAFGGCGGEDLDLLMRLERRGRRVAWCAEAGVRGVVPASRLALRYQLLRAFGGAQAYTTAAVKNDPRPRWRHGSIAARALVQVLVYTLLLPLVPILSRPRRRGILVGLALGLGKLAWRRKVRVYQMERRHEARHTPPSPP